MSLPWRKQNTEISSSSSGSVKQRLHFEEVIPILHCNCGNELTLQTSWTSDNPGRRFWNCVGINSKKIIPGLLKRVNRSEEEIERLKALLQSVNGPEKHCNDKCLKWCKWLKTLFFGAIGVVIGVVMVYGMARKCGKPSDLYRLP